MPQDVPVIDNDRMALLLKNLLFTVLVPGTAAVYIPLWIAGGRPRSSGTSLATAVVILVVGAAIYASSQWNFAALGRGTPAPIDAPKRARHIWTVPIFPKSDVELNRIAQPRITVSTPTSVVLVVYGLVCLALVSTCSRFSMRNGHLLREFGSEYEAYCKRGGSLATSAAGLNGVSQLSRMTQCFLLHSIFVCAIQPG